jgi:hypothetical protein
MMRAVGASATQRKPSVSMKWFTNRLFWLVGQCGELSGHMSRNVPFSSNTCMRLWPRSSTNSRRSWLIAMLWTVFHSFGPGFCGFTGA